MDKKEFIALTDFDIITTGTSMQMLKAYIPYLEFEEQRIIALIIRFVEMNKTMEYFKNCEIPGPLHKCSHDKENMMRDVMCYCSPQERNIVGAMDMFSNMSNMSEMFNSMSNMSNMSNMTDMINNFKGAGDMMSKMTAASTGQSSSDNSGMDMLKNFLSPEQKEMYESYQKILNE